MNNLRFREFYCRRLPHFQVAGATYFVTFRLANLLPVGFVDKLVAVDSRKPRRDSASVQWQRFEKLDDYLDRALPDKSFLGDARIADVVADAIHFRNGKVYDLESFCVMPTHAHLVCTPLIKSDQIYYGLTEILHSLKRFTARQANLILNRSGAFWQDESYDHIVRDSAEFDRIVKYVLYNPVKAGLVTDWTKWKWSYCKYDL